MKTNWHDWMRDTKKISPNDKETISLVWEVVAIATINAEEKYTSHNSDSTVDTQIFCSKGPAHDCPLVVNNGYCTAIKCQFQVQQKNS